MKECIQQCISTRFSIFLEKRPYYIDELCKISGQNHIVNSNSSLRLKRIRTLRRINRIRIFSFVEFPLFGLVSHVTKIRLKRTSYIFLLLQCLKYHFIIYLFINIPGTKVTSSPFNFTRELVDEVIFFQFSNLQWPGHW